MPAASAISRGTPPSADASQPSRPSRPAVVTPTETTPATSTTPSPIRQGTVADSARVRFVPRRIELPSGDSATVDPEQTVNGVLQVPADIRNVGWWDGSAYAGDPFGSTVIAGHVDSSQQGLGFFAELIILQVGDRITLRSDVHALTYRVASTTLVVKEALAAEGQALGQHGPHRLVLITCSGRWHPELRSYDSNLIVVAEPLVS